MLRNNDTKVSSLSECLQFPNSGELTKIHLRSGLHGRGADDGKGATVRRRVFCRCHGNRLLPGGSLQCPSEKCQGDPVLTPRREEGSRNFGVAPSPLLTGGLHGLTHTCPSHLS